jgi:hypothetical protein
VLFGRALGQLEADRPRAAGELFRRAAAGAGPAARWLSEAWAPSPELVARWERGCIDEEISGPIVLDERWIDGQSAFLARGLGAVAVDDRAGAAIETGQGLSFLPETGWLEVTGRVE